MSIALEGFAVTLVSDIDLPKVQIAARRCSTKLQLEPIKGRFPGHGSESRLCDRVLVGVDDIPSRWNIQRRASNWLAVGGTSHFNVSSSVHMPDTPCCGCLHPIDDPGGADRIPTVSFVSFWAGLAMTVRLLREALVQPYPVERQHLCLTPVRMDLPHAATWLPVASRPDCPVRCLASRTVPNISCTTCA
jgi:hypothetical protein